MKKVLLIISLAVFSLSASAQYYCIPYLNAGTNPGGLNTDVEYPPGGGLPAGWSTLMTGAKATPEWSANQSIPFTFKFNGADVTSYKVSSTGVLTFSTSSPVAAPSATNAALPSALLPDNSICVWGLDLTTSTDYIVSKTFGNAGSRQHWVFFNSTSEAGLQQGWTYWSIVLEEGSNNIYIVDQRTYCTTGSAACNGNTSLTVGVQVNGAIAASATGSPNVQSLTQNNPDQSDNSYYQFNPGVQKDFDLSITKLTMPLTSKAGQNISVAGVIKNLGKTAITSFTLNYTVNGGPAVSSPVNLNVAANGGVATFTHPTTQAAPTAGVNLNFNVWASDLNGSSPDQNTANDAATADVYINNGIAAPKKVLLEEGTGAWCQHCPDAHSYLYSILDNNPGKVIATLHHNNTNGPDQLTNPQSDLINAAYAQGYPNGYIDRTLFQGAAAIGLSRGDWTNDVATALSATVPVKVNIINKSWDPGTRKISFDVEAEFVDYTAGDLVIGAMIVENNIRGVGSGYDQIISSIYTSNPNHIYYNKKSPMVGYPHKMVVINIPSGAWGNAGVIPAQVAQGQKYTKSYSYTLPATTSVTIPATAEFTPTGTLEGRNKPQDIVLVGFVGYNSSNPNNRKILNAESEKLTADKFTSVGETPEVDMGLTVYPNPAGNSAAIDFSVAKTQNVTISLYNTLGQKVATLHEGTYAEGSHTYLADLSNLSNGFYFIKVEAENASQTVKLSVVK